MNPKGPMGTYESMKLADSGPWGYFARTLAPTPRAYGAQIGLPRILGSTSEPCTPNLDPSNPSRIRRTTSGFRRAGGLIFEVLSSGVGALKLKPWD